MIFYPEEKPEYEAYENFSITRKSFSIEIFFDMFCQNIKATGNYEEKKEIATFEKITFRHWAFLPNGYWLITGYSSEKMARKSEFASFFAEGFVKYWQIPRL